MFSLWLKQCSNITMNYFQRILTKSLIMASKSSFDETTEVSEGHVSSFPASTKHKSICLEKNGKNNRRRFIFFIQKSEKIRGI